MTLWGRARSRVKKAAMFLWDSSSPQFPPLGTTGAMSSSAPMTAVDELSSWLRALEVEYRAGHLTAHQFRTDARRYLKIYENQIVSRTSMTGREELDAFVMKHGPSCPDVNCTHLHCAEVRRLRRIADDNA